MSCRDTCLIVLIIWFGVLAPGCNKQTGTAPQRVFAAQLANLSADPTLDWFSRALSSLLVLRTPSDAAVKMTGGPENATRRIEGYFYDAVGIVYIRAAIRDLASQKVVQTFSAQGPATDILRISEELVRWLGADPQAYTTASVEAVRRLSMAGAASSVEAALEHVDASLAADSNFGSAHVAKVQTLLALNRPEEAIKAVEIATAPPVRLTPEEKLRLTEARALLTGNIVERARASRELARLRPDDLQLQRTAAELSLQIKDFPAAIESFQAALKIEPENIALWNSLGYAYGYAGDLSSATKAFEEYRRINPNDANALDSLGEVHFYLGRFAEAEKYFLEAFAKNKAQIGGGEALRAAMARLMLGDRATADRHFAQYIAVRKQSKDTIVPVREAIWQFWTGRRTQALAAMQNITGPPEAAVAARVVLTMSHLQFGDKQGARKSADEAASWAKTPQTASMATLARFLLATPSMKELAVRGRGADIFRRQLIGYMMLLNGNFTDAAKVWSELYDRSSAFTSNDERLLLAWAEAGRDNLPEVAKLMRAYSLPPSAADPALPMLLFPRSVFLKALAEQHAGNIQESKRLFQLFLDYSADRDFIYGEEKRARDIVNSR